jgi:ABC-2 type transport system permease protein
VNQFRTAWAIAKKDIRIYYLKGPVIIFGILFPGFLFMAFAIGRNVPKESLVPGLMGMALFFTASAVTPAVFPFETRSRTLERLLTAPLSLSALVAGDVLAAFLFGLFLSLVPLVMSVLVLGASVARSVLLPVTVVLSASCFAVLGTLFSTPPTDNASSVMTLANLVRLPLIFFSGVFLPIDQMPRWGQWLSFISPLTYTTELARHAFGQGGSIPQWICLLALLAFTMAFWFVSIILHRRNMTRRLWL